MGKVRGDQRARDGCERRPPDVETTYRIDPTTPGAARRFVGDALGDDAVADPDAVASAQLAVSELITNVIRHAPHTEEVTVRVVGQTPVRLEVIEHGGASRARLAERAAEPAWPPPDQLGGRGLGILDAISNDWGFERRGDDVATWCEIGPV